MLNPNFTVTNYGRFQSLRVTESSREVSQAIITPNYELEFYYEDCPGGLTINGTRYPVKAGGFTCCKPGQMRKLNIPYTCYFFNIFTKDPQIIQILDNLPEYGLLSEVHRKDIMEYCKKMQSVLNPTSPEGEIQIIGYVCIILGILSQQPHLLPGITSHSSLMHQKALLEADNYLREHLNEDVDLEKLAKIANLHPTYFHKLYTAAFNSTPTQQLYYYRIIAAQQLLSDDNITLSEIAEECGFSSQSFFSSKFKEATGYTPSQFRKQRRQLNSKK